MLNRSHIEESWVAFARIFIGIFWLYEVFIGKRWKLGTPTSGVNAEWVGTAAGADLVRLGDRAIELGAWEWFAIKLESMIFPYAVIWSNFATIVQVAIGIGLIVGVFTKLFNVLALGQLFFILHFGTSTTPPLLAIGHIAILASNGGRYYSVDGWLYRTEARTRAGRLVRYLANPGLLPQWSLPPLIALAGVGAVYYLFGAVDYTNTRMSLTSLEIGVLLGIGGLGMALVYLGGDRIAIGGDLIRLFVGFRLLQEAFIRESRLNGLPAWTGSGDLLSVFEQIADHHFATVSAVIEWIFLPAIGSWVLLFGAVQTAVGIALLVGWRTKIASLVGITYVGLLLGLGFVRSAAFVFGYLFVIWAIGGKYVSLDAVAGRAQMTPAFAEWMRPVFIAIAGLAGGAAVTTGIAPAGYESTMAGVVMGMVAIFGVLLLCVVLFQQYIDPTHVQPLDDSQGTVVDIDEVTLAGSGDEDTQARADD